MNSQKKPNIILITFDSGRPDHLSFNGYKKKTSPFLDSLVEKSIYFKNAFSTGPGSPLSFIGIFTSTYPLDYGGFSHVDRPRILFTEALKEAGYTTVGLHSSPYLSAYFGYDKGWDKFMYLNFFKSAADTSNSMSPGLRENTTKAKVLKNISRANRWLDERVAFLGSVFGLLVKAALFFRKMFKDATRFRPAFYTAEEMNVEVVKSLDETDGRPLFLWVHYLDTHGPYGLFGRKGRGIVRKLKYYTSDWAGFIFGDLHFILKLFMPILKSTYDDSVTYVDEQIEKLFGLLKERGILDEESIVIINSDHGEDFLEHGAFGHPQRLFNVNVWIPLVVYAPSKFKEAKVVERPVSLIDLAPTILDFAGAKRPSSFKGENLFNEETRDVVVQASESEGDLSNRAFTGIAIIRNGYKLIHWKKERLLYSLDDRMERKNVYHAERGIARDLEQRAKKYEPVQDADLSK